MSNSELKAYALEPRILFDAAAPAAIADIAQSVEDNTAPDQGAEQQEKNEFSFVDNSAPPEHATDSQEAIDCSDVVEALETIAKSTPQQDSEDSLEAVSAKAKLSEPDGQKNFKVTEIHTEDRSPDETLPLESGAFLELNEKADDNALIVIDSSVKDYKKIFAGADKDTQVLIVNPNEDGIEKISEALAIINDITSVHIVSHGTSGSVTLGNTQLDSDSMSSRSAEISGWADSLTENADILVYGCSVGEDASGQEFVDNLAALTGADVAASDDPTGAESKGGDWDLEVSNGKIESSPASHTSVLDSYDGILAAPSINITGDDKAFTTDEDMDITVDSISLSDSDEDTLKLELSVDRGAITLSTLTNLTIDSGSNGSSTITVSGAAADLNTALNGMKINGGQNYNGTAILTLKATDTGAETPVTTTKTVNLEYIQINDAPTLTPTALSVNESQQNVAFSAANLGLNDPDIGSGQQVLEQMIIQIDSLPTKGTLTFGGNLIAVGSSFSSDQIDKLKYSHGIDKDIAAGETDTFKVSVYDGAGGESKNETMTVNLQPVNSTPTVTSSSSVYEGSIGNIRLDIEDVESTQADSAANTTVTFNSVDNQGQGTLFLDLNNDNIVDDGENIAAEIAKSGSFSVKAAQLDNLKFKHNGNEPSPVSPSYVVNIEDNGGGTGVKASSGDTKLFIGVQEVDDDPTLGLNKDGSSAQPDNDGDGNNASYGDGITGDYLDVGTNPTKLITKSDLLILDVDTPDENLVYNLTAKPAHGEIQVFIQGKWRTLGINGRFTQKDINDNFVRYSHTDNNHADNQVDTFKFTVRDSKMKSWLYDNDSNKREGAIYEPGTSNHKEFTFNMLVDTIDTAGGGSMGGTIPEIGTIIISGQPTDTPNIKIYEGKAADMNGVLKFSGESSTGYKLSENEIVYRLKNDLKDAPVKIQIKQGVVWNDLGQYKGFTQADVDAGNVRINHDSSENFAQDIVFSITDGVNDKEVTFHVDIAPVNDSVITGSEGVNVTEAIGEGTTGIVGLTSKNLQMTDYDGAKNQAHLTLTEGNVDRLYFAISTLPEDGKLQYKNDAGNWIEITSSMLSGAADPKNSLWISSTMLTAETATSRLRYVHDGNDAPENLTDAFQFVVRDDLTENNSTVTGKETPSKASLTTPDGATVTPEISTNITGNNLSNPQQVKIKIAPLNDAPQVTASPDALDKSLSIAGDNELTDKKSVNDRLTVYEGEENVVISSKAGVLRLSAIDTDNTKIQRQFKITTNVNAGSLFLEGRKIGKGSTFTQADIEAGKITYTHNGDDIFTDSFAFDVSDGLKQDSGIFEIRIAPRNDLPSISVPSSNINYPNSSELAFSGSGKEIKFNDDDLAVTSTGEKDFIQVTISTDHAKSQFVVGSNLLNGLSYSRGINTSTGNGEVGTNLVIGGTKDNVQAVLDGLKYKVSDNSDLDTTVKVTVQVDDRVRNSSGNFVDLQGNTVAEVNAIANGGAINDSTGKEDVNSTNNITEASFNINVSNDNDAPTEVSRPAETDGKIQAKEDTWTDINHYSFADVDAFDSSTNKVTIAVTEGTARITNASGVILSGDNSGTLTLTGTLTQINTALKTLQYKGNDNYNGEAKITVTYSDMGNVGVGSAETVVISQDIEILDVNDKPTASAPSTTQYIVDTNPLVFNAANNNAITIDDAADLNNNGRDTFTVVVKSSDVTATLKATSTGTATITDNNTAELTVSGTKAQVNAALEGLQFIPAAYNTNSSPNITITVKDHANGGINAPVAGEGSELTDTKIISVIVSSKNDMPTVNAATAVTSAAEDTWSNITGPALIQFDDADSFDSNTNKVVISVPKGKVKITNNGGAGLSNNDSGSITITGTKDQINAALNSLQYLGETDDNGSLVTLTATYTDAGNTGNNANPLSVSATRDITITAVNDAPRGSAAVTLPAFNEDTTPSCDSVTNIVSGSFDDSKDQVGGSGTNADSFTGIVVVDNAAEAGTGRWQYSGDGGSTWKDISSSLAASSGLFIAKGDLVRFNPAENYNGTPGKLTVRLAETGSETTSGNPVDVSGANSGGATRYSDISNQITIGTSITAVNDTPTAPTATAVITATEDIWQPINGAGTISFADVDTGTAATNVAFVKIKDGDNGTLRIDGVAVGTANVIISEDSRSLTVTGKLTDINATLAKLEYKGSLDYNGTIELQASYDDRGNSGTGTESTTVSLTRTVNVAAVNDAPVVGSVITDRDVSLTETVTEGNVTPPSNTITDLVESKFNDEKDQVRNGSYKDSFAGIVIVKNEATAGQGVWEYSDDGTNWNVVATDLAADKGLVIAKDTHIRFKPNGDYVGTPGKLTARLIETGGNTTTGKTDLDVSGANSGGTTTYSDQNNQLTIGTTVVPVGDTPPTADPFNGTTPHDKSITVVLEGADPDNDLKEMEIKSLPEAEKGTLYHPDGSTPVEVGDKFVPEDAKKLVFKPRQRTLGTFEQSIVAEFKFITRDHGDNTSVEAEAEITITVPAASQPAPQPEPQTKPQPELQTKPQTDPQPTSESIPESTDKPIHPAVDPIIGHPALPDRSNDRPDASVGSNPHQHPTPLIQWGVQNAAADNGDASFGDALHTRFLLELTDQTFEAEKSSEFKIPAAAIHHTDPNAKLTFEATRPDGSALPPWITFDTQTKAFIIIPPKDFQVKMPIMVHAIDEYGNEAKAVFTVNIVRDGLATNNVETLQDTGEGSFTNSDNKQTENQNQENEDVGGEIGRLLESLDELGKHAAPKQDLQPQEKDPATDDNRAGNADFSKQMELAKKDNFANDIDLIYENFSEIMDTIA